MLALTDDVWFVHLIHARTTSIIRVLAKGGDSSAVFGVGFDGVF